MQPQLPNQTRSSWDSSKSVHVHVHGQSAEGDSVWMNGWAKSMDYLGTFESSDRSIDSHINVTFW